MATFLPSIRVRGPFIACQRIESKQKVGHLFIPETVSSDTSPQRYTVVGVGTGDLDGGKRVPIDLAVGDVVYLPHGKRTISFDGLEIVVCNHTEAAVVEVASAPVLN